MIEHRHTDFEAAGHAHAIDLDQHVARKVIEQIRRHHPPQRRSPRLPSGEEIGIGLNRIRRAPESDKGIVGQQTPLVTVETTASSSHEPGRAIPPRQKQATGDLMRRIRSILDGYRGGERQETRCRDQSGSDLTTRIRLGAVSGIPRKQFVGTIAGKNHLQLAACHAAEMVDREGR